MKSQDSWIDFDFSPRLPKASRKTTTTDSERLVKIKIGDEMGVTKAAGAVKPWRSTLGLVLFLAVAVVVVVWMVNANDEQGKLAHERAIRAMQEVGSEPIAQQRD